MGEEEPIDEVPTNFDETVIQIWKRKLETLGAL